MRFSSDLRNEYQRLFDTCEINKSDKAVLLRRMAEKEMINFEIPVPDVEPSPVEDVSTPDTVRQPHARPRRLNVGLPLRYSSDGPISGGEKLQRFLNQFPGVYLKVDSWPGRKTSAAFRKVFGYYLMSDPRA